MPNTRIRTIFTEQYQREAFTVWYELGKPSPQRLYDALKPDEIVGRVPSPKTLQEWIAERFRDWGEELDGEVRDQINEMLIAEKVEMAKRHAEIGQKMQSKALEYLDSHEIDTSASAVRLLVEGLRIEQENVGLPQALKKLSRMSDEDLLAEVMKITEKTGVSFEPNE